MYLVPLGILIKTWGAALVADHCQRYRPQHTHMAELRVGPRPCYDRKRDWGGVLVGAVYWFVYLRGERTR